MSSNKEVIEGFLRQLNGVGFEIEPEGDNKCTITKMDIFSLPALRKIFVDVYSQSWNLSKKTITINFELLSELSIEQLQKDYLKYCKELILHQGKKVTDFKSESVQERIDTIINNPDTNFSEKNDLLSGIFNSAIKPSLNRKKIQSTKAAVGVVNAFKNFKSSEQESKHSQNIETVKDSTIVGLNAAVDNEPGGNLKVQGNQNKLAPGFRPPPPPPPRLSVNASTKAGSNTGDDAVENRYKKNEEGKWVLKTPRNQSTMNGSNTGGKPPPPTTPPRNTSTNNGPTTGVTSQMVPPSRVEDENTYTKADEETGELKTNSNESQTNSNLANPLSSNHSKRAVLPPPPKGVTLGVNKTVSFSEKTVDDVNSSKEDAKVSSSEKSPLQSYINKQTSEAKNNLVSSNVSLDTHEPSEDPLKKIKSACAEKIREEFYRKFDPKAHPSEGKKSLARTTLESINNATTFEEIQSIIKDAVVEARKLQESFIFAGYKGKLLTAMEKALIEVNGYQPESIENNSMPDDLYANKDGSNLSKSGAKAPEEVSSSAKSKTKSSFTSGLSAIFSLGTKSGTSNNLDASYDYLDGLVDKLDEIKENCCEQLYAYFKFQRHARTQSKPNQKEIVASLITSISEAQDLKVIATSIDEAIEQAKKISSTGTTINTLVLVKEIFDEDVKKLKSMPDDGHNIGGI